MPLLLSGSDSRHDNSVSLIATEGQGLGLGLGQEQQPQPPPLLSTAPPVLLQPQPQQQQQSQQLPQQQQPQRYIAMILDSTTAAQREAYDSALQTVSYLIKYHHATRGDWTTPPSLTHSLTHSLCALT